MGGTMKSTTVTIDIWILGKRSQWSFVWRPSVTAHWWKNNASKENKNEHKIY